MGDLPRILIVITLAEAGGAQSSVASLLPALTPRYDVVVAAHGPGPMGSAAEAAGARYVPLTHLRREINPWRDALGLAELVSLCKRERPQILHANCSKAGVLGLLAATVTKVPVRIFTTHGWPFIWSSGFRGRIYLCGDRLIGRLATSIVCVSAAERRAALSARVCAAERTMLIYNAVDVGSATNARPRGEIPTILSVGRLAAPKDFSTLLTALAQLEQGSFRARIVGDGPERTALETEAERLGLGAAAEFLGERNDVSELLAQSDVFVLPSRSEALPMSVLEAMAAGLPVVGSAVGGVPELLEGHGHLVAPGDADALAASLRRLIEDPELRARDGELARHEAETRFDLPLFHRSYLDLYERELARSGSGAP